MTRSVKPSHTGDHAQVMQLRGARLCLTIAREVRADGHAVRIRIRRPPAGRGPLHRHVVRPRVVRPRAIHANPHLEHRVAERVAAEVSPHLRSRQHSGVNFELVQVSNPVALTHTTHARRMHKRCGSMSHSQSGHCACSCMPHSLLVTPYIVRSRGRFGSVSQRIDLVRGHGERCC